MHGHFQWAFSALLFVGLVQGDAATMSVFAGGGSNTTGRATECRLADPFATDFDARGNAFICEMTNHRVLKVDSFGKLTVFAGTTKKGSAGDGGPATQAELNGPHHLIVAKNGDVLIADTWNWRIRRIDATTGIISTLVGTGKRGYSGDGGSARNADFSGIYCLAFDSGKENLYLADLENRRIRAVSFDTVGLRAVTLATSKVRLVAGNGQKGVPADGSDALTSPLFDPRAVAVAKNG